jgi:hypothetical protein
MCPSSGETTVFMQHLVLVILYEWLSGMQDGMKLFLNMFISFLYMFRATMCPSSGEATVFMQHLVFVILYGWLSGVHGGMKIVHQVGFIYEIIQGCTVNKT